jgi:hypothetical protein
MLRNEEIFENRLENLFPLPCLTIITRGTQDGIIVKFKTFYLKIYNRYDMTYDIKGYRYNEQLPIFEININDNKLREFCSKFTREDYLLDIKKIMGAI